MNSLKIKHIRWTDLAQHSLNQAYQYILDQWSLQESESFLDEVDSVVNTIRIPF